MIVVRSSLSSRILGLAIVLAAGPAVAVPYDVPITADDQDDLEELYASELITEEQRDELQELLDEGVDLNSADRDELYELPNITYAQVDAILELRAQTGHIDDPADLVRAGAIPADLLPQIAPFLVLGPDRRGTSPLSGRIRTGTKYAAGDPVAPAAFTRARVKGFGLSASVLATTTRRRLGAVAYDPGRRSLTAQPATYGLQVPKYYLEWKTPGHHLIGGTFRAGFGQRLTLDNTSRTSPNGIYADDQFLPIIGFSSYCRPGWLDPVTLEPCPAEPTYAAIDYKWADRFRGVGGRLKSVDLGVGKLSLTGIASYQSRSVYQYAIYDRDRCADPRADTSACAAPRVTAATDPNRSLAFGTLPNLYDEALGGANATLELGFRRQLGITGYWARDMFRVQGINLDFQEWSRRPFHGPFGAVGVDASWGQEALTFAAEVSRSFDSMPGGGGGYGAIQRTILSGKKQEAELALRYYDRNFANPYARPMAAPDMLDGFRPRNEAGARLKYNGSRLWDFRVRGSVDFWIWPYDIETPGTAGTSNVDARGYVGFEGWKAFQPGVALQYRNRDLSRNSAGDCSQEGFEIEDGELVAACGGDKYKAEGIVRLSPWRQLVVTLRYGHTLVADSANPNQLRQDARASASILAKPLDDLTIKAKARWLDEDVLDPTKLETSVWTYFEVSYLLAGTTWWRFRYDVDAWVDSRESTALRRPNPVHHFTAELEVRF